MIGVTAYGFYVPRHRLERAKIAAAWGGSPSKGEIAVANYDEDALTMATEAVFGCLEGTAPDALFFASTSAPYQEKQVASYVATACDFARSVRTADFGGSVRAGVSALVAAHDAVRAGSRRDVVVAAADARLAAPESELEGLLGAGAAALRVGTEGVVAEIVDGAHCSEEFTHFWRTDEQRFVQAQPGKFSNSYGFVRDVAEAARGLLERHGLAAERIAALATYAPDPRAALDLCRKLGLDAKAQLVPPPVAAIGSAGCADPLLALGAALDTAAAGDWILVAGYGEGADVLLLRATDALEATRARRSSQSLPSSKSWQDWLGARLPLASYEKYLKHRRILGAEATGEAINNVLEFQERKQDVRLYGSRCLECEQVQYPVARVCLRCGARERMAEHRLAKTGAVFTFTVDYLIANAELPLPMAVVDLDGGGRLYLQVTDFAVDEIAVGLPVQLTYRRLHEGGGNVNYYWKARPLR